MRTRMFLYAALLAAALAGAMPAAANEGGTPRRGHPARQMLEELNLTPEQEAKFREINARYAPARRDNARIIEELRVKINQELMRDKPSRNLLIQYSGQMGEHQKKMNIASVDHMLSVKAVLTPEQFKKFTERVTIGGSGGRGRRGGQDEEEERP